jgi:uncharacterized protein YjbJ (UPF0337 family)
MSPTKLKTHWKSIKGQLQERFGHLTDDDLAFAEGKGQELLERLQEKLGISRGELNGLLDDLSEVKTSAEKVKARVGQLSDGMRARAEDLAGEIREKASELRDHAIDQARQGARGILAEGEEYVRRNPREALVGSMIAGYLVGVLFFRR